MQSTPNYSRYDLDQLYDVLDRGDLDAFPERLAAVKHEIVLRGGEPDRAKTPTLFVSRDEVTPILRIVRWLFGLECGAAFFAVLYLLSNGRAYRALPVAGFVFIYIFGTVCALGVAAMRAALKKVDDKAAVEAGWLTALGFAPFSAVLYGLLILPFMDRLDRNGLGFLIFLFPPLGFTMPFVLLSYWLKYKYRQDEF